MFLKTFRWSFIVSGLAAVAAVIYGGIPGLILAFILCLMEVALSFDNAVVNAKVLQRMSPFWQMLFLTVGMLIAVFFMRLVFPLLLVGITASLSPIEAFSLAMEKGDPHEPGTYGYILHEAHPQIAGFGGMFLGMLFLEWVFSRRDITWLSWLERPLARVGDLANASTVTALVALVLVAKYLAHPEDFTTVLVAGVLGAITFLVVSALGDVMNDHQPNDLTLATGRAAFGMFMYLEVLDASFSFDGVIGAFAITNDPIIIMIGLAVGALFVRSITIYLVRTGTLAKFTHLEHGAHWAIGALAAILLITVSVQVSEFITGGIGVALILTAVYTSMRRNKKLAGVEQVEDATPALAAVSDR